MSQVVRLVIAALLLSSALGCAAEQRTANLIHVVLFKFPEGLSGPKEHEFYHDVSELLVNIPTVQAWFIGPPAKTRTPDRPFVDDDYDVAIAVGFAGHRGLQEYLYHPDHVAFVKEWESLFEARVFDFSPYSP